MTDPGAEETKGPEVASGEVESVALREGMSPYSTGGGGVTFERKVAVQYLAHLLVGDAAFELGDGRAVVSVAFQQAPDHPVDDLVVHASRADEAEPSLLLAIGVRRAPDLVQSDEPTQKLIREFLRAVITAPTEGVEHRFALVVSGSQPQAKELAELAALAATQMDGPSYFSLVRTPKKFTAAIRGRLDHLEGLVKRAVVDLGYTAPTQTLVEQRTWELLARLAVPMPRLESPDESDWVGVQNSLVRVARDTDLAGAARLRDRLVALADEYSPKAATIDLQLLSRDAHAVLDTTVRRHKQGWQALNHLHERALASVREKVSSRDGARFARVDRSESASALLATIADASAVLVHGESGVGKSALVLSSIVAAANAAPHAMQALCINLRQLPPTTVNFEISLGCELATLLGELSAPQRCLIIDGADASAEGMLDSFRYIVDAAYASSVKVIAVSAEDSKQIVHDTLLERFEMGVAEYTVTPLTDAEVDSIVAKFPELLSLAANTRSRDLLRRLVVVDLFVRGGVAGVPMNDADAMREVWNGLVRRRGQSDRGSPDARAFALVRLAERDLTGGSDIYVVGALNPDALDGLRHDGLLRASVDGPFRIDPEFAHDEVRRYAVAYLLLQDSDPTSRIVAASAPRWALGAARLACQAMLAMPDNPTMPLRGRFAKLQAAFNSLVDAGHGERWGDVPGEALLTMGDPDLILRDAWSELSSDKASGIRRLSRLIQQRHRNEGGIVSIVVVEPLVKILLEDAAPWRSGEYASHLLRDWLRAHVIANTRTGHPLRIRLREQLVAACNEADKRLLEERDAAALARAARSPEEIERERQFMDTHRGLFAELRNPGSRPRPDRPEVPREITDKIVLELLSLLGPDLGEHGEAILRRVGQDAPHRLPPAIENPWTGRALASYGGDLLAELTDAYYVDEDEDGSGHLERGIRDHEIRSFGVPPLAAWFYGPFMPLFQTDFRRGVAVLNRMLNHAALVRARTLASLDSRAGYVDEDTLDRYNTEFAITGARVVFVGDSHVWRWYRGSGVGPYPCMSALQALERVCDQCIEIGIPLANLAKIMLDGCTNLAMVGLAVGLLVRHVEKAERLLDPYLAEPRMWELEFDRLTGEHSGYAAASEGLVAPERRSWSLREAAMTMVLRADDTRADEFRAIGERLVENASRAIADAREFSEITDADEVEIGRFLATVRIWAGCLDRETYTMHQQGDAVYIQSKTPADIAQVLEPGSQDLHRSMGAMQLFVRYGIGPKQGGAAAIISNDELAADLATARDIVEHPSAHSTGGLFDAPAAVAAAALEAHLLRGAEVSGDGLRFAAETVMGVGEDETSPRPFEFEETYFGQGADRSAARAVPLLLLPIADSLRKALDGAGGQRTYQRALAAGMNFGRAVANEVRLHLARGLDRVWEVPCTDDGCHHGVALEIAVETIRDCVVGDWDPEVQRQGVLVLGEPVGESLANTPDDRIVVARLDAAIRALAPAAMANICISSHARDLLLILFVAQRRALLAHKKGGDSRGSHALASARALLTLSSSGDETLIYDHIDAYADNSELLNTFLRALSAAAEEVSSRATAARRIWPNVIKHVLALNEKGHEPFGDRYHGNMALAALVPNLAYDGSYLYHEVVEQPIAWWDVVAWQSEIDAWLQLAVGHAECVDRLISFVRALSPPDQVRIGQPWVATLVLADPKQVARGSYLISDWLIDLRSHAVDVGSQPEWQRVVDALVVAGVSRLAPYSE